MPFATTSTVPADSLTEWTWLAVSVIADIVLSACLVWLVRHLARSLRESQLSLDEVRRDLVRRTESLRLAADLAEVGVWFWHLSSGVIEWNDCCQAQFSLPPGKPPSLEHFYSVMHPEDRERVHLAIEKSLADRAECRTAFRVVNPDGTSRWMTVLGRGQYDPDGRPVSMGGVTIDVTRLRTIEEELRTLNVLTQEEAAERHRLRGILEAMLDPLAILRPLRDPGNRVTDFFYADANPAACAWFGIDRKQLLGRRLLEHVPQVESSGLLRQFVELADGGRPLVIDGFPFPLHGTDLRRMDVRGIRVQDEVAFVWRDVTDRHAAQARVAESEEQFRLLAENTLDIVVRLDAGDRVRWVSPSITAVLGWSVASCVGRRGVELFAVDDSHDVYVQEVARAMAGEGIVSRARVSDAAGSRHWMEVHTSPWRSREGRIDGVVKALRIVDAEVAAGEALERRARTDDLTQLLNRSGLLERLEALIDRGERRLSVLWCDIDRFKEVNDAHGHAAGDQVLRALGDRIRGCLRTGIDIGGRIGGDELMVLLVGLRDLEEAAGVAEAIRRRAAEPIAVRGGTIEATLSIGVAVVRPDETADSLLARADDAMYRAKEAGRNRVVAAAESGPVGCPADPAPVAATAG